MTGLFLLALASVQSAQPDGTAAARCRAPGPVLAVNVTGFANRRGTVRVRLFGGAPSSYFDKKHALVRIEDPVPRTGPVTICVPLPRAGVYAVDVRHDFNGNGKTDRQDGGGTSGNPKVSLFDIVFSRRPDPKAVQIVAGPGRTNVSITMKYLQGGSFRPIDGAN